MVDNLYIYIYHIIYIHTHTISNHLFWLSKSSMLCGPSVFSFTSRIPFMTLKQLLVGSLVSRGLEFWEDVKKHTIHVWYIYLHLVDFSIFFMVNVGNYTIHGCHGI